MSRRLIRNAALLACSAAALVTPAVAAADSASTGSVTVSMTSPVVRTTTHSATIDCAARGSDYVAAATTTIRDYQFTISDSISGYTGDGTYPSTARLTVRYLPTGAVHSVTKSPTIDVTSSGETGQLPFSMTLTRPRAPQLDRQVAGTISWTCDS